MKRKKKFSVVDIVIVAVVLITAFSALIFINSLGNAGNKVEISVDGEVYKTVTLKTDKKKEIEIKDKNGKVTNILVLENDTAYIKWASCKNQDCVKHNSISKIDESIICLPNKVEVRIISNSGVEDAAW